MPPGEVSDPKSNDGFLKSGYLKRYDLYDDDGMPSKIPVLNAQDLKPETAVIFDVVHATISANGNAYFIPVAVIRDEVLKDDWDAEWNNADIEKDKIKIKAKSIIKNVGNDEDLKGHVGKKIDELRIHKPKQHEFKDKYLKQL